MPGWTEVGYSLSRVQHAHLCGELARAAGPPARARGPAFDHSMYVCNYALCAYKKRNRIGIRDTVNEPPIPESWPRIARSRPRLLSTLPGGGFTADVKLRRVCLDVLVCVC